MHDWFIIYPYLTAIAIMNMRERSGTLNPFYRLEQHALSAKLATHVFLVYEGQEWTYRETYDLTLKHATWLRERHGVKPREIVAMDFTNSPSFIFLWLGLWALGATPAFLNYNLEGERLAYCVTASTASLLLVEDEVKHVLDDAATRAALEDGGRRRVVVWDAHTIAAVATWRAERPADADRRGVKLPEAAMLIYTSGTTGMPKPAVVSWFKINFSSEFATRWMRLGRADRFYTSMPLYHSSAAVLGVNSVLAVGCTLVVGHKFSIRRTLGELRESRATIFQYVGETCRYLLSAPPAPDDKTHSLRLAFGNGLRPDVWREFRDRFGIPAIGEFYASTEGMSGLWHMQTGEYGIGAIGRNGLLTTLALKHGSKLVQLDYDTEQPARDAATGLCTEVGVGEVGELVWKLDPHDIRARFQGYFGNEKSTGEKVLRDVFVKGDAWFRTGDLQRYSRDGLWYFVDRIGDTFRWKSENVSTAEVAGVVGAHPAVADVAVYGVALPKHDGKAGCAAVVLAPGWTPARFAGALEPALAALPRFARPVFVRFVDELEKTGNNKHVKRPLVEAGVEGGEVAGVWWCPAQGGGYVPFGPEEWKLLGRGDAKL